jgi:hypothetical protein
MTVRSSAQGAIVLEGACPSEDADVLVQHLLASPEAALDWRACEAAHSAVIQVLMAARPRLVGPPAGEALRAWVEPNLQAAPA